jgi:hypothetical protein
MLSFGILGLRRRLEKATMWLMSDDTLFTRFYQRYNILA